MSAIQSILDAWGIGPRTEHPDDVTYWHRMAASAIRAYKAHEASAVPEEIAELVERLRRISPNHRYADCMGSDEVECIQRAADLLEGFIKTPIM